MLRTSHFTIYVDLPGERDQSLIAHGYSGAFDKVSTDVVAFLRAHEERRGASRSEAPQEAPVLADRTLRLLEKRGYLTEMSREDEEDRVARLVAAIHERAIRKPPAYVLMHTYQCNLRCAYCFQDRMRTDPALHGLLRTMSRPVVDRIFAAIPGIEKKHLGTDEGRHRRSFLFFGGEPLLAASRPIVEYVIEKARALGECGFTAVTNGTDLHHYRDLLGPEGLSYLQITLDGPPDLHDRRRIHADGSGSFERIAENISLALDAGTRVSVRINTDRTNLDELPRLAREILDRGWN